MTTEAKKLESVDPRRMRLSRDGLSAVLLGTRCRQCGTCLFGERSSCRRCNSNKVESERLNGRGILYSYTIIHRPPTGWTGRVPYALGEVQLPEGPHVLAEVVDCPFHRLRIGLELELALEVGGTNADGDDIVVYKWRPATGDGDREEEGEEL